MCKLLKSWTDSFVHEVDACGNKHGRSNSRCEVYRWLDVFWALQGLPAAMVVAVVASCALAGAIHAPVARSNWRELLHHHTCQRAAMDGAVCFISHSTACDPAPDGAHMSSRDFRSTDTARFNRRPRYDYAACNLSSPTDFLLLKFPWRLTCFFGGQRVSPGSLRDEQAREIKRPCSVTCSCLLCGHSEPL